MFAPRWCRFQGKLIKIEFFKIFTPQCACPGGYYAKDDSCIDIDECTMNMHNCNLSQKCNNLPGSYECGCDEGKERGLIFKFFRFLATQEIEILL